jgi:hypothetical protein
MNRITMPSTSIELRPRLLSVAVNAQAKRVRRKTVSPEVEKSIKKRLLRKELAYSTHARQRLEHRLARKSCPSRSCIQPPAFLATAPKQVLALPYCWLCLALQAGRRRGHP